MIPNKINNGKKEFESERQNWTMADLSGQGRLQKHMSWVFGQIIVTVKLDIVKNIHNIRNIIYDEKRWQKFMTGGIGETNL